MFILNSNLIVSQNTTNIEVEPAFFDEERPIKYRVLNDFNKLVEYASSLEVKDSINIVQLGLKDSIIIAQKEIIDRYENKVVPSFEHQLELLKQRISLEAEVYAIDDEKWQLKYDKLRSKRFGLSAFAGAGISGTGFVPSIGVGASYTFIRF